MKKVYILDAMRTPIMVSGGKFSHLTAEMLGAKVVQRLLEKHNIKSVDGVFAGNAVGTGGNMARLMALTAGLPQTMPACTVDTQCASGASAISLAYAKLLAGQGEIYLAGGMESISLQPKRIYAPKDFRRQKVKSQDGSYKTAQFSPDDFAEDTMLRGAERVIQAEQITKAEMDAWVLRSHSLAAKAADDRILADYITPVDGWASDDGIKRKMSQRLLDRLPLIFGEGTLTNAGNACRFNDGAAFALLASESYVKRVGVRPVACILSATSLGGDPAESPRGAMRTADALLQSINLEYDDFATFEFNEAFAAIDVLFARAHPELVGRYLPFGGALAYGHPYGASGAILLVHALAALQRAGAGKGLVAIAGAGGIGEAIAVEWCGEFGK